MTTSLANRNLTFITVLRRDYLQIVGDFCAAKLINYFRQWEAWKRRVHRTPWVYRKLVDIQQDLMGEYCINVIRRAISLLIDLGILERRPNPGNYQDKTWQYKLNVEYLDELLKRRKINNESSIVKNDISDFKSEQHDISSDSPSSDPFISDPTLKNIKSVLNETINNQEESSDKYLITQTEIPQELIIIEKLEEKPGKPPLSTHEDKFSALGETAKKQQNKSISTGTAQSPRTKHIWEIALGQPYPAFLQWWADKFYKPQGGHWEANAKGFAYNQFYKNPDQTTYVIFQQFLEYMERATNNCYQQLAAGVKNIALPSCLLPQIEATEENTLNLMDKVKILTDQGVRIMLPGHGSMSVIPQNTGAFTAAPKVESFPQLLPPEEKTQNELSSDDWQEDIEGIDWAALEAESEEYLRRAQEMEDDSILNEDFWQ